MKNRWFKYAALLTICVTLTGCKMNGRTRTVVLKDEKKQSGQLLQSDKIYQYDFRSYSDDMTNLLPAAWGEDENTIIVLLRDKDGSSPKLQKVDYRFGFFEDYGKLPEDIIDIYSLSPGGRYMICSIMKDETRRLMAADLITGKTTELLKLTDGMYDFQQPVGAWSGSGKSYYFTLDVQGGNDTAIADSAGGMSTTVNNGGEADRKVMKFDADKNTVEEIELLTKYYSSLRDLYSVGLTVSYDGKTAALYCLMEKYKSGAVYTEKDEKIYYIDRMPYGQPFALDGNNLYYLVQSKEIGVIDFTDTDFKETSIKKSFSGYILNAALLPDGRGMVVEKINLEKTIQTVYYDNDNGNLKNEKLLYQITDRVMDMLPNPQGTGIMLLENAGMGSMMDYGLADNYGESSAMILKF